MNTSSFFSISNKQPLQLQLQPQPLAKQSNKGGSKTPREEKFAAPTPAAKPAAEKAISKAEKKSQQQRSPPAPTSAPIDSAPMEDEEAKEPAEQKQPTKKPAAQPVKRVSITPATPIPSIVTPITLPAVASITPTAAITASAPVFISAATAPIATSATTPLIPASSVHTPFTGFTHHHRSIRTGGNSSSSSSHHMPGTNSAVASAAALLGDFQSSAAMARLCEEKDAAYELLLAQHRKLKETKKVELGALVDGAAAAAEQHVRSGAAMVAHWKAEVAATAAENAKEQAAHQVTRGKLATQEEETQQYINKSNALEQKLEEITKKRQCPLLSHIASF
jgi:hypothetical protein